jgi:hypothetical protein
MDCRCEDLGELHGDEASNYADQHLARVMSEPRGGAWLYRCPLTSAEWILDFPREWDTGHGGRARLRRVQFREPERQSP